MKKIILTLITLVIAASVLLMPAGAVENGTEANVCNKNTARLIVGDSRCYQLWKYDGKGSSFVAVWGGHYGPGCGDKYTINSSSRRKDMKRYIRASIEARGKCTVFIFATINDYNRGYDYNYRMDEFIKQARELKKLSYEYNGKAVKPKVYIVKLIGYEPEEAQYNKKIAAYNKRLAKLTKKNGISVLDFSGCLKGKYQGYKAPWNLHYSKTTLKHMWREIKKY